MTLLKKFVLLLKAQTTGDSDDKYENVLHENGYDVSQVKTIDFNFINLNELKKKVSNPSAYTGFIFSSPRCVEAVKKSLGETNLPADWKNKQNYVVGESTHKSAYDKLQLDCFGKSSGNGKTLSEIIIKDIPRNNNKPFLMPCGNLRTDTIENSLKEFDITTEAVVVYETISNPNLLAEVSSFTDDFKNVPEFIVFFSPSGVKAFTECLVQIKNKLNLIKFLSIGPTTSKAIHEAGLPLYATAKKPNPDELLLAIRQQTSSSEIETD